MSEKTYINGVFIKESKYGIKMSIKAETFCEQIKKLTNEKGYVNIEIKPRKQVGNYGDTHYAELDTWKSEAKTTAEVTKEALKDSVGVGSEDNDLLF